MPDQRLALLVQEPLIDDVLLLGNQKVASVVPELTVILSKDVVGNHGDSIVGPYN